MLLVIAFILLFSSQHAESSGGARIAQRNSDINTFLNAVWQYKVDNGIFPEDIPYGEPMEICASDMVDCTGYVNLGVLEGEYLYSIPSDPRMNVTVDSITSEREWYACESEGLAEDRGTGYTIVIHDDGSVEVASINSKQYAKGRTPLLTVRR